MVFLFTNCSTRDAFSFEIVRMPFICSNIPSNIFYSAIFSEILRIIRCTLKFEDLKPRLKSLFERMIRQGASHCYICRQINKGFLRYPEEFGKFGLNLQDFIKSVNLRGPND